MITFDCSRILAGHRSWSKGSKCIISYPARPPGGYVGCPKLTPPPSISARMTRRTLCLPRWSKSISTIACTLLLLLLFCVYLDCQIARPSFWMGATLCCVWTIKSLCGILIIFAILLAVSLRSVWSLQNISVLFTFVVLFVWIPLH